jgi:hypothetical protein
VQATALSAFTSYMGLIQAAITAEVSESILAVWSRSLDTTFGVTRVLIGDVLDVQRRRRDALREAYLQATYP